MGGKCDEVTVMSDEDRLIAYREYYRARAARYAANPDYPATAAAERRLCDAVEAASSMAELMQHAGGLALECGKALAADQANARAALYARTAEDVRAQAPAEVLAGLGGVRDAAALAALAAGAEQRMALAVTADELTRLWSNSLTTLENVEVWRSSRVAERWRAELDGYAAEALQSERGVWAQTVAAAQQHQPGWRMSDDTARAVRHRRLVPMSDVAFEARLGEHRSHVRGEN